MLYVENVTINGREFTRTWSDKFMIERDGVMYSEAIDPIGSGRTYTETDVPLDAEESEVPTPLADLPGTVEGPSSYLGC